MDIEKKLNKLGKKFLSGNWNNFTPVLIEVNDIETGVTIPPTGEDAFMLKNPVAGIIKTRPLPDTYTDYTKYYPRTKVEPVAIQRSFISYIMADRMIKNPQFFQFYMMQLINAGLLQLQTELNDIRGYNVFFERSGQPGVYFKTLDSHAAVEFRIVLTKNIEIKEEITNE